MKSGYLGLTFILIMLMAGGAIAQEKLSIDDCIAIALKQNTQVKNAGYQLNVAKSQRMSGWSGILPNITFNATTPSKSYVATSTQLRDIQVFDDEGQLLRIEQQEVEIRPQTYKNYSANVTAGQTIWDMGSWYRQIQRGISTVNSGEFNYQNTAVTTIQLVKQRYLELAKAIENKKVLEDALEHANNQLNNSQIQFNVGAVPQNDVFRSQAAVGQSQIELLNQELAIENAQQQLNLSMGYDPSNQVNIEDMTNLSVDYTKNLDDITANALSNNQNIRRLEEDIKGSTFDAKIARSTRYPSVSYYAQYSRRNPIFENLYENIKHNYSLNVGLSFRWTLFDGFQTRQRVHQAENTLRMNEELFENEKRTVGSNVKMLHARLAAYQRQIEINEMRVRASEENFRLEDERYKNGAGTLLVVIDAQRQLTIARYTLVAAEYDAKIAETQLDAALGLMEAKYDEILNGK